MLSDLPDIAAKQAALAPERIALEEYATGRTFTYAELNRRAGQAAALLNRRGVEAGDRVAILSRNCAAFFELLFACAKVGAICVPLNWRMPPAELDQLLTDCTPKLLFYGREEERTSKGLMYPPPAISLDRDYERRIETLEPLEPRLFWPAEDIWYLLYTSGTTGRPKGVIYTFGMAVANYVNIGSAIDLRRNDVTASFLPFFHTAGINLHALPTLMAGGRVTLIESVEVETLVTLFEERRFDTFFAVPTVYQDLLDQPRFAAGPLDHVRHWGCGGAPLPDAVAERYRQLGVRVCNGMGMTETGPTAFLLAPEDAWDKIGSVGKPQLLSSVRIVDDDGRDVTDGIVGKLLFAGPGVTPGYWRNEEATREAFTEDGWLRSGDLARRDDEGFYYIAGREKEMFISGGENVYPAEVENVLCSHPAVVEAAVVPVPHEKWGEVGYASLMLAEDNSQPSREELEEFCRARLAPYKVPQGFAFVPNFPRTAAGKVQKHLLR
ncbi:MAG TPA: AMP-binding protein [Allosphingosinicella sp.]|uniref:class I adenylate-forming enzyme family protein n=1 Tax=Allosphingosinicella sp. TaxID=2823234 RepID=UPI002ED9C4C0